MGRTLGTVLALAGLFGCVGSDGDGGQCSGSTTCGGDLEGSWNVEMLCSQDPDGFGMPFDDPECSDAVTSAMVYPSGTFTFDGSGQGSAELYGTTEMTVRLSEECFSAIVGRPLQWTAELCMNMADTLNDADDDGITQADCELSGDACVCNVVQESVQLGTTTFTVDGNQLDEADGAMSEFCREDETLRVDTPLGVMLLSRQ